MPSRREFLKTGAMVTTGAALLAAGEGVAPAVAHASARIPDPRGRRLFLRAAALDHAPR